MTRRTRRMLMVLCGLLLLGGGVALVLSALGRNIVYFFGPSDLLASAAAQGPVMPSPDLRARRVRLGGLVAAGSVTRGADQTVSFIVTDGKQSVPVRYQGLLPDLFREGQGVVAEGRLAPDGIFQAESILAKHDERYMPRDVADALKKAGEWRPESGTP